MNNLHKLFLLFFVSLAWHSEAQNLTLSECQKLASENYPYIRQYALIEKTKQYHISNANKSFLPQLSITGMAVGLTGIPAIGIPPMAENPPNHQIAGIARLDQTLWDGGLTRASKEQLKATAQLQKTETDVSVYALYERVNQIYFSLLLLQKQQVQLTLQLQNLAAALNQTQVSVANGIAYRSDLDLIKVAILSVEQQMVLLRNNEQSYRHILGHLIGRVLAHNEQLELPHQVISLITPEILALNGTSDWSSLINRPELNLFSAQKALHQKKNDQLTGSIMPKIGIFGQAIYANPGLKIIDSKLNHVLVGGLSVSWEIGNLYTLKNSRQLVSSAINGVDIEQANFLYELKQQLIIEASQLHGLNEQLLQDDEIVALRESVRKASEVKCTNGVITTNELIQFINDESTARLNRDLHQIELLLQQYKIQFSEGYSK